MVRRPVTSPLSREKRDEGRTKLAVLIADRYQVL
jgi:hypothetical protein